MRLATAVVWTLLLACPPVWGHSLSPALLDLRESSDGLVQVTWKQSSLGIPGTPEIRPVLPASCRTVSDAVTRESADSLTTRWAVDCRPQGLVGQRVGVEGLAGARTDALIRVGLADGQVVQTVARASEPIVTVLPAQRPAAVISGYLKLGVEHILGGPDHLLFVLGLLLLAGGLGRVLETVTAFALGHSITLSLAVLGVSRIPSGPIEVAIAVSIYVLAVELARAPKKRPTLLGRFPWIMAFVFGLLHGFGFAGALREAGLPPGDVPRALLSFNVGIELGQLAFVLGALAAVRALHTARLRLPAWSAMIPAYAIGSLAVLWCLERAERLLP